MAAVIGFLILLALDIPAVMLRGFVLSRLWEWFIVPLGVGSIGVAHAIGLSMLVGMVAKNPFATESDDDEKGALVRGFGRLFGITVATLIGWGFGAIVHGFM